MTRETLKGKLVRDRIPEIIRQQGEEVETRILEPGEFALELKRKLSEEVDEYFESDNPQELADVLEVVYALAELQRVSRDELEWLRLNKRAKRGGFERRIFLVRTRD